MRTTLNLPDDLLAELRALARERGETLSATVAAAAALRHGVPRLRPRYRQKTYPGRARVDLTKATQLAFRFDDEEKLRRLREQG